MKNPNQGLAEAMKMAGVPGFKAKFWDAVEAQFPENERLPNPYNDEEPVVYAAGSDDVN